LNNYIILLRILMSQLLYNMDICYIHYCYYLINEMKAYYCVYGFIFIPIELSNDLYSVLI